MNKQTINTILNIRESYELPQKLLESVLANQTEIFEEFLKIENDLSYDWFVDYFQEVHGDRKALQQDFTPKEISQLVCLLSDNVENGNVLDVCSGTGSLTLTKWAKERDLNKTYYLEEYSSRALPILLFNLAIRNMNAIVWHGDVLTREQFAIYKLTKSDKFSHVEQIGDYQPTDISCVVMNPPYSHKWQPKMDERFQDYGLAPQSKADYAFILHGLSQLNENGTLIAIMPHGVLFRDKSERKIRQKLIELNLLDAVIGLPKNLFLNTDIPVCMMILKKNRRDTDNIALIDASKQFEKQKAKPKNKLTDDHIQNIVNAYKNKQSIAKYSEIVTVDMIKMNDYNLNIPRYVDTFEEEEVSSLEDIMTELVQTENEIKECEKQLFDLMNQLVGTNEESDRELKNALMIYENRGNGR